MPAVRLISLLLLCLVGGLLPGCTFLEVASPSPAKPFDGVDQVIIRTVDSPEDARRTIAGLLTERGYAFRGSKSSPTLVTRWTVLPSSESNRLFRVSAFVDNTSTDTAITLRGWLREESMGADDGVPVVYYSSPDSSMQKPFAELQDIARAYPGGSLFYTQD